MCIVVHAVVCISVQGSVHTWKDSGTLQFLPWCPAEQARVCLSLQTWWGNSCSPESVSPLVFIYPGIIKTHNLGFQECEALQAVFTKDLCPNCIIGPAKLVSARFMWHPSPSSCPYLLHTHTHTHWTPHASVIPFIMNNCGMKWGWQIDKHTYKGSRDDY